ncbi:MAG: hypothetical protein E7495_11725 [Ruminococcus flavefaciens]|jgi:hypothetical protein|nr:hypothetical protein [Ruminococcus flavefaciens]
MYDLDDAKDYIGFSLIVLIAIAVHIFLILMLWRGIRSFMGKTLNLPPSRRRWLRTRADVIQDEERDSYQARYYVESVGYTADIEGFTVYGDKAIIYVNRKQPTVVKEFVPVPALGFGAALSSFFVAAVILFFDFIIIFT